MVRKFIGLMAGCLSLACGAGLARPDQSPSSSKSAPTASEVHAQSPGKPGKAGRSKAAAELSHVERFRDTNTRFRLAEEDAERRLRRDPKNAEALGDRGMALLHLGENKVGLDDLRQAARLAPKSALAQAHLAYGLWLSGSLDDALTAARAAVGLNPNLGAAQYYAGRLLLLTGGDAHEAVDHLQRATQIDPDPALHFDLLDAYRAAGDAVHARVELRLLESWLPPGNGRLMHAEGLIASDSGQLPAAVEDFQKAVEADPGFTSAWQDLGLGLAKLGKWQEAAAAFGTLAHRQPDSYTTAYFYALALQNSGQGEDAEREVRRTISLRPGSADAYTLLGIVLGTRGDHQGAATALEKATALNPASFDAQLYLGRSRYALQDYAGAGEAFRAAVNLAPGNPQARFYLATVLEQTGDRDGALAEYRELVRLSPNDPRGYVGLGNFLAEHGETDEAMQALKHARELDPADFEATFALGRLLARQEQWKPAIALLREATERNPQSPEAHYQLGLALRRDGQAEEATKEFALVDRLNQQARQATDGMSGGTAQPDRDPKGPDHPRR